MNHRYRALTGALGVLLLSACSSGGGSGFGAGGTSGAGAGWSNPGGAAGSAGTTSSGGGMWGLGGAAGSAGSGSGGGGASGGSSGSGGSAGNAGGGGGGVGSCDLTFVDPSCNSCVSGSCGVDCATCSAEPACLDLTYCLFKCASGDTTCQNDCYAKDPTGQTAMLALFGTSGCVTQKCANECYSGSGGSGGAGGTGGGGGSGGTAGSGGSGGSGGTVGGTSVSQCQGKTGLALTVPGQTLELHSGFAIYASAHHEVYGYTRQSVTDYAYGGQSGETKLRLVLPLVTGPGKYQGLMGVSKWDTTQGKWVDVVTPSDVTTVTIADAEVITPTGLMCNGRLVGQADALFNSMYAGTFVFDVPLLTPTFPHTQPGPP